MLVEGQGLRNQYWLLRHGRSIPNESRIIVSLLSNGLLPKYGLAPDGVLQAKAAGELFLKDLSGTVIPNQNVRIYASPFSRTRETAEAVSSVLKLHQINPHIQILNDLRERYFGTAMELQSHDHYPEVWDLDARDPMSGPEGGESAADVGERIIGVIKKVEAEVQGYAILIISHGDPLQILQTIMVHTLSRDAHEGDLYSLLKESNSALVLAQHRKFAMLTGELRQLGQA